MRGEIFLVRHGAGRHIPRRVELSVVLNHVVENRQLRHRNLFLNLEHTLPFLSPLTPHASRFTCPYAGSVINLRSSTGPPMVKW